MERLIQVAVVVVQVEQTAFNTMVVKVVQAL
jgi:hypothetical protein